MEFKNTEVSAELVPEGVNRLYQGHVAKAEAATTAMLTWV